MIIGAGGAARAFAFGLATFIKAKNIDMINRTLDHAKELASDLAKKK